MSDGDFIIESASAPAPPHPDDTTLDGDRTVGLAPPPSDEQSETPPDDGTELHSGHEAEVAARTADPAPRKSNKKPLSERIPELKRQVDQYTFQKRQLERELADRKAAGERELAELTDRIAKAKTGDPSAVRPDARTAPVDGNDPMPEHPHYRDFATDEEYEAAVAKWKTKDLPEWNTRREQALEQRLTEGLDARLRRKAEEEAMGRAEAAFVHELTEVATADPQWEEKKAALNEVESPWYDPTKHGEARTPFLSDLVQSRREPKLLSFFGADAERTQALAELLPSRPLRDALVGVPSLEPILAHFATPQGRAEFEQLKRMPPATVFMAVGALSARLATASRGSVAPGRHPITAAVPPARPPAGSPGVRSTATPAGQKPNFLDWMAEEDAKRDAEIRRNLGLSVSA